MNIPTILLSAAVAAMLVFAIRYLVKNGMCAACEDREACQGSKKAGGNSAGCGGKCSSCRYYEAEQKAAAKHGTGA